MVKYEESGSNIAKRLKAVRMKLKIQQKEMAQAIQKQPSYFCAIDNGHINPGAEFFIAHLSITWWIGIITSKVA